MKVYVPRILTGLVACMLTMQTAWAQPNSAPPQNPDGTIVAEPPMPSAPLINDAPGQAVVQNYFGYTEVDKTFDPLIRVDTRGGSLYGQGGFTRLSIFEPYWIDNSALVFVDLGGYATYNPSGGANVGAGWRYYMEDLDRIIGINGWYDYDNGHQRAYHQFGVGFESLGRYIDYRVNGYIPFGDTHNTLKSVIAGTPSFINSYIFLNRFNTQETAFKGFDAEMGGPLPFIGRYGVSAYVGGYFFTGRQVGNVTGVSARVQGQVNENVTVGAQMTHDSVFDTNAQVQVTVTLPDGSPGRWLRQSKVRDRMTAQVIRNYRVVAHDETVAVAEVAINPLDNQPYFVAHVDPNRTPGTGNGTVENPFSQISQFDNLALGPKSHYDIIYVAPRVDGTSTQLDTGVTLLSDQHLWSTSVAHTINTIPAQADANGNTSFAMPGFVAGALPVLSNITGGDVVTFTTGAHNVEVSGFTINGSATGNGIAGLNNSQVNINRNVIQNGVNGVALTNLVGTFGTGTSSIFDSNQFIDNLGDGLRIVNTNAANLDLTITNNTMARNDGDGVHIEAHGSTIGGLIDSNTTVSTSGASGNGGSGIFLLADNGTLDFLTGTNAISNNNLSFNGLDGLTILSTNNSNVQMAILDNKFGDSTNLSSPNTEYGVFYGADSGTGTMLISGNTFFSNGLGGIAYALSGTNVTTSDITNNSLIINSQSTGNVILSGFNQNSLAANDDNSTGLVPIGFTANFFGINFNQVFVNNNGNITLNNALSTFTPFPIVTNGEAMIAPFFADVDTRGGNLMTYGTGTFNGHTAFGVNWPDVRHYFAANDATTGLPTNNFQMVLVDRSDTGAGNFDIMFNYRQIVWDTGEASGGNAQGLYVGPGGGSARAGFTNGVSNSFELAGSGVPNAFLDSGPSSTSLINNSINSNLLGRYVFEARNGQVTLGTVGTNDAIQINTTDNAQLVNSSIDHNTISGNAGYGVHVNSSGNSQVTNLLVNSNTVTNNDGGIKLETSGNATIDGFITNNIVTQNKEHGLSLISTGSNPNAINILSSDNQYSHNGGNGIDINSLGSGIVDFTSTRDQTSSNLNGVNIEADEDGVVNANFFNLISINNNRSGINLVTDENGQINLLVDSPTDALFTGTGTTLNGNSDGLSATAGGSNSINIFVQQSDTTQGLITDLSHNSHDGVNIKRNDSTLVTATFIDTNISNNGFDGIQFYTTGAYPTDPTNPNQLTLLRTHVDSNGTAGQTTGGIGLDISTLGDSMLLVNATTSTFNNNIGDGIRVFSGDASIFGDDVTNQRSTFDNVQMVGNGGDGMHLFAMGNNSNKPLMLVDVNSDSGTTLITDNGDDGIGASAPYGTIDLLVRGTTLGSGNQTIIQRNADNGIEFNVANLAQDGGDNQIYVEKFPPSGLTSPPHFDVDLTSFSLFNGVGILNVQNVTIGDDNSIHGTDNGNGGDGIHLFNSNGDDFAFVATAVPNSASFNHLVNRAGSLDVTVNNSIIASNVDNGINFLTQGLTDTFDTGNVNNITVTNSHIAFNGDSGVTMLLNGKNGDYNFDFFTGTYARTELNQFVFDNNVIEGNHNYGFYYESNAGQMTRRDFQQNTTTISDFWGVNFADPGVNPGSGTVFDPDAIGAAGFPMYQAGYNADQPLSDYMSIVTDINATLTFTNNVVQNNGTASTTTGDGVFIRIGTDTYLGADMGGTVGSGNGNVFSGNAGADVRFGSFVAYAVGDVARTPLQPPVGTPGNDTANPPVNDHVFLDDTAQLDLRFNNNTGRKLDDNVIFVIGGVGSAGLRTAAYDNVDPTKGGGVRPTQIFQLDDGVNVNANNPNWIQFPDLDTQFGNFGNFHLRTTGPDPLFPNPAFPQNYNANPGDPFLP